MKKLLITATAALLLLSACNTNRVQGNGHIVSKTLTVKDFKNIDASSSFDIYLEQGPEYSLRVEAEDNLIPHMDIRTKGDDLVISFKEGVSVNSRKGFKVYVTAPEFRILEASGACNFTTRNSIKGNKLKLDISGAGTAKLEVAVNKLEIDASGASEITLKGQATYLEVDGSGTTDLKAFRLQTQHSKIDLSGAGDAEVVAEQSLDVELSGAASVTYKGDPPQINKNISGAGSVTRAN